MLQGMKTLHSQAAEVEVVHLRELLGHLIFQQQNREKKTAAMEHQQVQYLTSMVDWPISYSYRWTKKKAQHTSTATLSSIQTVICM